MKQTITILLLVASILIGDCANYTASTSGETTIYSNSAKASLGLYYWPDGQFGIVTNGDGTFNFYSDAAEGSVPTPTCAITKGSMDAIASTVISTNQPILNLLEPADYAAGGPMLFTNYGGTNYWIMFWHREQWPGGNGSYYYASIGMARSTDGTNFYDLGIILSQQFAYSATNTVSAEIGTASFYFVGNELRIPFQLLTNYAGNYYLGLAQCDLGTLVSAVASNTVPLFLKYANGSFSANGTNGVATPAGYDRPWATVAYWPAASLYVMLYAGGNANNNLYICTSADGTSFTNDVTLRVNETIVYPTLFSPDAAPNQIGVTNYIFGLGTTDFNGARWDTGTLIRLNLNLALASVGMVAGTANVGTITQ